MCYQIEGREIRQQWNTYMKITALLKGHGFVDLANDAI